MKSLIVYSSRTGNTQMLAEAVSAVMPNPTLCPIGSIDSTGSAENYQDFDLLAIGYWVDKGLPDEKVLNYFKTIKNTTIILFGTLGAYPDSAHAQDCIQKAEALLSDPALNNTVLGSFLCMGKVDPKLLTAMAKMPQNQAHPMTDERKERIEEAKKHPNEADLLNVQTFIKNLLTSQSN